MVAVVVHSPKFAIRDFAGDMEFVSGISKVLRFI
jgi:hypothetical protein